MKKTSKTIVFFGNERLATGVSTTAPTLQALMQAGYHVAAVVSNYERGQSRSARTLEIAEVAKAHDIPVLLPTKLRDITDQLQGFGAEAAVLVAYGKIVPSSVITLFPKGIINIHPSLLPLHRGPTPLESVILSGEQKTGVSLMQLAPAMDAGPVYAQSEIALNGSETKQELADASLSVGSTMLIDLLPGILDGSVVALPQDDSRATYDQLLTKEDGVLDWNKPAEQLEREIRAFVEWPKSRATLAGKEVIVTKAHAIPTAGAGAKPSDITPVPQTGEIIVATSQGSLSIDRLKPAGKSEMTAKAFLAGYAHLFPKN